MIKFLIAFYFVPMIMIFLIGLSIMLNILKTHELTGKQLNIQDKNYVWLTPIENWFLLHKVLVNLDFLEEQIRYILLDEGIIREK